jgi:7,8-dihydro-6-hydroxymethylpterin-pyrophosphokinase
MSLVEQQFWLLRRGWSFPTLPTHQNLNREFFLIPKEEIEAQAVTFDSNEEIQTKSQDVMKTLA